MRIYLAGRITAHGLFKSYREAKNKLKFFQKAEELRKLGIIVYNPPEKEPPNQTWSYYLAHDIINGFEKFKPDAAYFMKGWKKSSGAKLEHEWCRQHKITIIYET